MRFGISNLIFGDLGAGALRDLLACSAVLDFAPTALYGPWAQVPTRLPAQPYGVPGPVIGALQSLFFGVSDVSLVKDDVAFEKLKAHLEHVMTMAASSGIPLLIFGSPGTRAGRRSDLGGDKLQQRVAALADAAKVQGMQLCFEVNSPRFGCEFLTTNTSLTNLLAELAHDGLALHLDVGQMVEEGIDVAAYVAKKGLAIRHLHLSAPDFTCRPELLPLYRDVIRCLSDGGSHADIVLEVQKLGAANEMELVGLARALAEEVAR